MLRFAWGQDYCGSNVKATLKARTQERAFWQWSSWEMIVEMERRWIPGTFVLDSTRLSK